MRPVFRARALFAWGCALGVAAGFGLVIYLKWRDGASPISLALGGLIMTPGMLGLLSLRIFREQFRLFDQPSVRPPEH